MQAYEISHILLDVEGCITEQPFQPWPLQKMGSFSTFWRIIKKEYPGMEISLCTGRQAPFAEAIIQALGLPSYDVPHIVLNGTGLLFSNGKFLWNPCITEDALKEFQTQIIPCINKIIRTLGATKEMGKDGCISLRPPSNFSMEEFYQKVGGILVKWIGGLIEITHSMSAVDITIKGVNKASGVEFWADYIGIKIDENVAGFGDSRGDHPMLNIVAYAGCPANATAETKDLVQVKGGLCSEWHSILGVIDFISKIIPSQRLQKEGWNILSQWNRNTSTEARI